MKRFFTLLFAILVILNLSVTVSAHGGRTDSSGGHKDNKNVSGLGSYHYHCGGYPAHLHTKGYCPYRDTFPTSVSIGAEKTTLTVGEKTTLTSTVSPSNACNTDVNWKSSDTKVITIKNGVATAVGAGTATITGTTFNDKEASFTIRVAAKPSEKPAETPVVKNTSPAEQPTTPEETEPEDEGSTSAAFVGLAAIVGAVILFKRKR